MAAERRATTLIALLRRTTQAMVDELSQRLAEAGYPNQPAFGYVLEYIDPEGTRLTTLAARSGRTHQAMGELVERMDVLGYVERVPDSSDRRARIIRLTRRGQEFARASVKASRAIERTWKANWKRAGLDADLSAVFAGALDTGQDQSV